MNHLGIDIVGKRKCSRAALKDDKRRYLMNSSLVMIKMRYTIYSQEYSHAENVLLKSSLRIHRKHVDENSRHTVEENEIDTKLANPYKTKIIATEAKIKSDKLDARILSDLLLRTDLIYESYVPNKEDRDKRSLVRHIE